MSMLFLLIAVSAVPQASDPLRTNDLCNDEPCALVAAGLDDVDGLDAIDPGPYAWIEADLRLARLALVEGANDEAVELAAAAHLSLTAQADQVVASRGLPFLLSLHRSLSEVLEASGEAAPALPVLEG